MFVFGNFLYALANVLDMVLNIYLWIVFARAILSWVNPDPYNPIVQFLIRVTEPVLYPIRRMMPYGTGIDFSPIIVIFAIYFLKNFVVRTIFDIALRLR
ncbi:MAG TPA: YggT family protein [Thermodesulfobacteriota bacterium]|nr:YggT family protein [Thermodesulfobacteriota bacterium]